MPIAIVDLEPDDRRTALPDCVDRVLGKAAEGSTDGKLDLDVLNRISFIAEDSNIDRVQVAFGVDVLVDGTIAVRAVVEALKRRLATPIQTGETLRLVTTTR